MLNAWLAGDSDVAKQQVIRGQILGLLFLEEMTLKDIRAFYGLEPIELE